MSKLFLLTILFFLFTSNAHAYLDPGTGSILLSAIIAGLVTIKTYWRILVMKTKNIFSKKKKESNKID
tara:strand:- start:543 stop:746 length:204 start_codon:yes stop_codon:yes gene_type:complete